VPSVTLSVESLTAKDIEDLAFGLKHDIDFVALSFVRRAEDVKHLKERIAKYLPDGIELPAIIVKIEKHEALENFPAILAEADGIMIARGDLGLETPATAVPLRQKELIAQCVVAGKPVITATHMLESMRGSPRPTRAEVSDVANAVIDHTDAVMLSGETAMGHYPVKAVETMAQIITDTEDAPLDALLPAPEAVGEPASSAVAAAAVTLARNIGAAAILVTTRSGYSARQVARFRPRTPLFAATDRVRTRQQLLLSWGITPLDLDGYDDPQTMSRQAITDLLKNKQVKKGDSVVVVSGLKAPKGEYESAVRVVEV
jgi:pyruvate kinase